MSNEREQPQMLNVQAAAAQIDAHFNSLLYEGMPLICPRAVAAMAKVRRKSRFDSEAAFIISSYQKVVVTLIQS
jgi:hypothetical protein